MKINHYSSLDNANMFPKGIIIGLMLLVGLISIPLIYFNSIRLDEAQSIWQVSHSVPRILDIIAKDVHVPLYHLILHYWQGVFGNSIIAARYLSLMFLLFSIPLVYILAKKIYTKNIAIMATVLFSIAPFINWYGNEARMYSLLMFVSLLNTIFFVNIFKKENGANWFGFIITAVLGIYTHYFFWLLLVTDAVFYFAFRKQFPKGSFIKFLGTAILLVAAISPWLYYVVSLGTAENSKPILQTPTTIDFFNIFSQYLFGFQPDIINSIILSGWPIIVILIFTSLQKKLNNPPLTSLVLLYIIVPTGFAFLISYIRPIFLSRYLIVSGIFLFIYIAYVLNTYFKNKRYILYYIYIGLVSIALIAQIVNPNTPAKENFQGVSSYLEAKATPRDVIVLSAPFTIYPFEYYYQGVASVETYPLWDRTKIAAIPSFNEATMKEEVDKIKEAHEYMYVVLSFDQGYEETFLNYLETNFERVDKKTFSNDLHLYQYKLRYDSRIIDDNIAL